MSSSSPSSSSPQTVADFLSVMISDFGSSTVNLCSDSAKSHQTKSSAKALGQLPSKSSSSSPSQDTMGNFLSDLISEFGRCSTLNLCSDSAKSHQPISSKRLRQLSSKSSSTRKVDNRWSSSNEKQQSIPKRSSPTTPAPTPRKSSRTSRCALRRPSLSYHPKVQGEERHQREKHKNDSKASPIGLLLRIRERQLVAERENILSSTTQAIPTICSVLDLCTDIQQHAAAKVA